MPLYAAWYWMMSLSVHKPAYGPIYLLFQKQSIFTSFKYYIFYNIPFSYTTKTKIWWLAQKWADSDPEIRIFIPWSNAEIFHFIHWTQKWAKLILFQRAKSDPCPLLMHKVNILGCYPTGSENTSITIDIEWLLPWYWLNGPDFEQNRSKKISPLGS